MPARKASLFSMALMATVLLGVNTDSSAMEEQLLELQVNAQPMKPLTLVLFDESNVYLSKTDWQVMRLIQPETEPLIYHGAAYWPITSYPDLTYEVDNQNLVLAIKAPARAFEKTTISKSFAPVQPQAGTTAAVLSYDGLYDVIDGEQSVSVVLDGRITTPIGHLTGDVLTSFSNSKDEVIRLETAWHQDFPAQMASLTAGDATSVATAWGRPFLYGGLQYKTDFATQPGFSPYPRHQIAGKAVLPSTLELYANNIKLVRKDVAPGPFNIEYLPPALGTGTVRVVTTDLLGREHEIDLPFYASTRLLEHSLHRSALDAGFMRSNFGLNSADYDEWFVAFTDAYGFSRRLTTEWRFELMERQQSAGVSATWLPGDFGVLYGTAAGSNFYGKGGYMGIMGLSSSASLLSLGLTAQYKSFNFRQLGDEESVIPATLVTQGNVGLSLRESGSLNFSMVHKMNRRKADGLSLSLGYTKSLFKRLHLSILAVLNQEDVRDELLFLTLTHSLSASRTAVANTTHSADNTQIGVSLSQALPPERGFGYQFNVIKDRDLEQSRGQLDYKGRYGLIGGQFERQDEIDAWRVNWRSSLVWMKQGWKLSRPVGESFALVEVPGMSDIDVYLNNKGVAKTDASGMALLPVLNAYDKNVIAIQGETLPLDVQVSSLNETVTPYRWSGIFQRFNLIKSQAGFLQLKLANGEFVPAGAKVYLKGRVSGSYPVAYDGEVYLPELSDKQVYVASWDKQACEFMVDLPASDEAIVFLGEQPCL